MAKILFVDDVLGSDPKLVKLMLPGFKVTVMNRLDQLQKCLDDGSCKKFDVLLIDWRMHEIPYGEKGHKQSHEHIFLDALSNKQRSILRDQVWAVITNHPDDFTADRAEELGGTFIYKDPEFKLLLPSVKKLVANTLTPKLELDPITGIVSCDGLESERLLGHQRDVFAALMTLKKQRITEAEILKKVRRDSLPFPNIFSRIRKALGDMPIVIRRHPTDHIWEISHSTKPKSKFGREQRKRIDEITENRTIS